MDLICVISVCTGILGIVLGLCSFPILYLRRNHPFVKSRGRMSMFFLDFGLIFLLSWLVVDSWHCGEFPHVLIMIWLRMPASWAFMMPIILRLLRTFSMWVFVVKYPIGKEYKDAHGKDRVGPMDKTVRWMVKHRIFLTDKATWIVYSVAVFLVIGMCTMLMFTVFPDADKTRDFKESTLSVPILSIPVVGYGTVCALILAMVWKMRSDAHYIKREFQSLAVLFLPLMGPGLPLSLINEDTRKWGLFLRIVYLSSIVAISLCGVLVMSYRWDRNQRRAMFSPSWQSTTTAGGDDTTDVGSTCEDPEPGGDNFWVRTYRTYGDAVFKKYLGTYCPGDAHYVALSLFDFVIFVDKYKKATNDVARYGFITKILFEFVDRGAMTPIPEDIIGSWELVLSEKDRIDAIGAVDDFASFAVDKINADNAPDDLFDATETAALRNLNVLFGSSFVANYQAILTELSSKEMISAR